MDSASPFSAEGIKRIVSPTHNSQVPSSRSNANLGTLKVLQDAYRAAEFSLHSADCSARNFMIGEGAMTKVETESRLDIGSRWHVDARCYDGDLAHHRLSADALAVALPALVVPIASKPASSKIRALAASQAWEARD